MSKSGPICYLFLMASLRYVLFLLAQIESSFVERTQNTTNPTETTQLEWATRCYKVH